jgi:hypothetical protein
MLQMHGQCYHVIRMHLQRPESIAKRFPERPFWARLVYESSTEEKWTGPDLKF